MKPSGPVSVGVGVVLLATSAGAFVQAPARCIVTQQRQQQQQQQQQQRARTVTSRETPQASFSRSSPLRQQQQQHHRQRGSIASFPTLFAEGGEDGGSSSSPAAASALGSEPVEEGEEKEEEKPLSEAELAQKAKLEEIERLRAKEKFTTVNTGDHECLQCSFVYKPGEGGQGALPGTAFDDLPSTWVCPVCKAPKDTFVAQTKTIAGFEDNASYGFGGNQMTGGQKNLLIFGSLAAFFVLFLAGYALE